MTRSKRVGGLLLSMALILTAFAVLASPAQAGNLRAFSHERPSLVIVNPLSGDTIVGKQSGVDTTISVNSAVCVTANDPAEADHVHAAWQFTGESANQWREFGRTEVKRVPVGSSRLAIGDTFNCDDSHAFYAFNIEMTTSGFSPGAMIDVSVFLCGDGAQNFVDDLHPGFPLATTLNSDCDDDGNSSQNEGGWDEVTGLTIGNPIQRVALDLTFPLHGDDISSAGFTATWSTSLDAEDSAIALCPWDGEPDDGAGSFEALNFETPASAPDNDCIFKAGSVVSTGAANITWDATFTDPEVLGLSHYIVVIAADPTPAGPGPLQINQIGGTATFERVYVESRDAPDIPAQITSVWAHVDAPGTKQCLTGATSMTSQIDPYGLPIFPSTLNFSTDNPVLLICTMNTATDPLSMIKVVSEVESGPGCVDADTDEANRFGNVDDANPIPLEAVGTNPCSIFHPQKVNLTGDDFAGQGRAFSFVNSIDPGTTVIRSCVDTNGNNACDAGELTTRAQITWTPAGRNHNHIWRAGTESADCHSGAPNTSIPAGSSVQVVLCFHDAGHNAVANQRSIFRLNPATPSASPGFIISNDLTTNAAGKAFATIGSSVSDAGRTTSVHGCGDLNADGLCDANAAEHEVHFDGSLRGTTLTMTTAPAIGVIGTVFTSAGVLTDATSAPVQGVQVTLQRRPVGASDWSNVGTTSTSPTGGYSITHVPAEHTDYRAVFGGTSSFAGSQSPTRRAWVRVGVALSVNDPTLLIGQAAQFTGRVTPNHPGANVLFQTLTGSGWTTVAIGHLPATGLVKFNVGCGSAASKLYRLVFPTQDANHAWNKSINLRVTCA